VQERIPKRIIQTGKSADLPLKEKAAVCNLKLLNPDFEYLFFDDQQVESFMDQQPPEYRRIFDTFPFRIQRYDFFRYLAVHQFGGFYFDLDVFLASSLSGLLECSCVFPFEGLTFSRHLRDRHGMDWQIGNYAFGAARGHPFLQAVIENCLRAQKDEAWVQPMMTGVPFLSRSEFVVLNTTGPGLLSRTLAENPALATEYARSLSRRCMRRSLLEPIWRIGVHLMDGSWRKKSGWVRRRLGQYLEVRRMDNLLAESRRQGKTRSHHGPDRPTSVL
jgi:hypothetical protein